ncbi:YihY/virulence factor BrkB family protein [Rhizobiaceae bacterium CRRU44]|uniref:YihY/virulence factor BrkB family protein n=1 Tax=Ferranicluibacter rubi TaxID=2715133 RepID=A0AA43ZL48_9HYPH|nr:YihY/virulence factor BrkB family protein [Ferranicluibacter rubi]NHT78451.1 YihY/virulence factor BrkB family protein [Ferranicluibacter rubi]
MADGHQAGRQAATIGGVPLNDSAGGSDRRGRLAEKPSAIPYPGLKDVFWRVIAEIGEDRVTLIAAGVTYYLLLALFPALAALVSIYGFVADPGAIGAQVTLLADVVPTGSLDIILDQLKTLATQKTSTLSIGFVFGLVVALWSAHNGMRALFDAMNIAYGETEKRGFLKMTGLGFLFTLGALGVAVVVISAIGILPAVLSFLWLDRWVELLARFARWPLMLAIVCFATMMLYRYGPSRETAQLRWLTWGAAFTSIAWLGASLGFSYYIENFANYNATYGTLGALIGFMVWTWMSVIILIVGAEINAELEHQTTVDSTTGHPMPMGERGAYVADTIGDPAA